VESKSNITANAQGLILSERAAGNIIAKNHQLFVLLCDSVVSVTSIPVSIYPVDDTFFESFKIFLTIGVTSSKV